MKLKGVSWIEANFEKLIVGVMLVLCLAVLVLQFVVVSNKVEVGGKTLSLRNAFTPAQDAAERVIAEMGNDSPALPAFETSDDLAGMFRSKLDTGISPVERFIPFGEGAPIDDLGGSGEIFGNSFAVFVPPTPEAPVVASSRATLDPYEVAEIEGLSQLIPDVQPYDTQWMSVEIRIDDDAIEAAFRNDPDGAQGEVQPLPTNWWERKRAVLAIEAERQERQPDGSWSVPVAVGSLPGRDPFIDLSQMPSNWRELDEVASDAARFEDAVLRPQFYGILEGEQWRPPSAVPAPDQLEANEDQVRVLERQLASLRSQKERRESALDGDGGRTADSGREGGREGVREGGRGNQPENEAPNDARRERILAEIERFDERIEGVIGQLEGLGWSEEEAEGGQVLFDLAAWIEETEAESGAAPAWAHDIRLDQGAVYRYRTRLVMANPLFGRQQSLSEELKDASAEAYVRSAWSEWSRPVETGWSEYFFVESANAGGGLGGRARPSARGELYRFHYGYWRRASVALSPGDRFVAEVDLPEGLQIWKTEIPPAEQAWEIGEDAEQPETLELLDEMMAVAADAWLLDVIASPFSSGTNLGGQTQTRYEAVIRGPDGQVSRRSPDMERSSVLYQRIAASSAQGADQIPSIPGVGQRARPAGPGERGQPGPDRFPGDRPDPGRGGGGGGGHGGGGG